MTEQNEEKNPSLVQFIKQLRPRAQANVSRKISPHLHDDIIRLQLPECFEASYCIRYFFFCEESLMRDNKDCSEMHSGSRSPMTSSCKCPTG